MLAFCLVYFCCIAIAVPALFEDMTTFIFNCGGRVQHASAQGMQFQVQKGNSFWKGARRDKTCQENVNSLASSHEDRLTVTWYKVQSPPPPKPE